MEVGNDVLQKDVPKVHNVVIIARHMEAFETVMWLAVPALIAVEGIAMFTAKNICALPKDAKS